MAKVKDKINIADHELMQEFNKKYGNGAFKKASYFPKVSETTSTGSISLDKAIGIGGIPKDGKVTQIIGDSGASKTTLAAHIIIEEQKKGNICAFLDIENTLDLNYIQNLGVDLDMLYLVDTESLKVEFISGEEWLMICSDLVASSKFGIIVLDSVAALTPNAELQDEWSNTMGKLARMLSQGFRMITTKSQKSKTGIVLLNQWRNNIGGYGNPKVEAGGESLKYYTSVKIELTKRIDKDTAGNILGAFVKAKVSKNKLNPPYGVGEYYLPLGQGIDIKHEIIELALRSNIIIKTGNTYSYEDTKLGVGINQLKRTLEDNYELLEEIKEKAFNSATVIFDDSKEIKEEIVNDIANQIDLE